jgi:para-aminobenzoate synthetase/4-amino-4-deoxychorismate lyase
MRAFVDFPAGPGVHGALRACFEAPREVLVAWQPREVPEVLRQAEARAQAGAWCVGGLNYEAAAAFDSALQTHAPAPGWPLACFGVFDRPMPWAAPAPVLQAAGAPWQWSISREQYGQRVEPLRCAIAAGECYQVNLTAALQSEWEGDPDAWMVRLQAAQPGAYLLRLDWGDRQVLSASPELFFDWDADSGRLTCRPMKGTAARHVQPARDRQARDGLLDSPKERAENVMIVDLLRNDLGRIAVPGSVQVPRLFELEAWSTVWQMTSTVTGLTRPGCALADVFGALFPCGSVTGAPKVQAMQWIRELEDGPRGVYCGALGVLRPGGSATFNVPIRTLAFERAALPGRWRVRYGVGSAITWDSDAAAEWRELAAKSRVPERIVQAFELLETLRLQDGRYSLLAEHLDRMGHSAGCFGYPWDRGRIEAVLASTAREHPQGSWRVRLTLDARGRAQCGADALPATNEPVLFALSDQPLDTQGADAEFITHKTTRRGHYESRLRQAPGLFDTLLVNERGELTEFTRGNLALRREGRWLTPALHCGLLPGTMRQDLLARGVLAEAVLSPQDLRDAEEVAFFNSLRGWLAARQAA